MILGILLTCSALLRKNGGESVPVKFSMNKAISFATLVFLFLANIYLMRILGFVVTTVLFLLALMMFLAPAGKRRPVLFLAVSLGTTAVIYTVFVIGFKVMLPTGIFVTLGI